MRLHHRFHQPQDGRGHGNLGPDHCPRKGETIQTLDKHHTNPHHLTELMVGRAVDLSIEQAQAEQGEFLLDIKHLTVADDIGHDVLHDVNLQLRAGEILGIAGIANSGQRELCESIVGMMRIRSGSVLFCGGPLVGLETREIIARGISMSFVHEDRLGMGLVASMDMVDNVLLKSYHHQKTVLLDRKSISDRCRTIIENSISRHPEYRDPGSFPRNIRKSFSEDWDPSSRFDHGLSDEAGYNTTYDSTI